MYGHNNPLTYTDPTGTECPSDQDVTQASVREEFHSQVTQGNAQWKSGDRGERFRTGGYNGPTRASYTKPMAIDAAKRGNFEAAEFYENYMCPSCHLGRVPDDPRFTVEGYVQNYQNNYRQGQCMVLSAAAGGGLAATLPRVAAVAGAWTAGTSLGQAFTGRSVGIIDPMNALTGNFEIGRQLSMEERIVSGVVGAVGVGGMVRAQWVSSTALRELPPGEWGGGSPVQARTTGTTPTAQPKTTGAAPTTQGVTLSENQRILLPYFRSADARPVEITAQTLARLNAGEHIPRPAGFSNRQLSKSLDYYEDIAKNSIAKEAKDGLKSYSYDVQKPRLDLVRALRKHWNL